MEETPPTSPRSKEIKFNNPPILNRRNYDKNGHYDVWNNEDLISIFGHVPGGGKTCDLDKSNIIIERTRREKSDKGNKYIPIG